MTNRFKILPQNHPPKQEVQGIEPRVVEQIKEDLRDLFRSAKNPIAILLQTMETDEFKGVVSNEVANSVRTQLQALTFENEDDFVAKVITVAMPVLKITKRGKKDAYKQEGREMFTEADMEATVTIVRENGAEKIYVVGNVGSGKTTFSRELSRALNYKNIDIKFSALKMGLKFTSLNTGYTKFFFVTLQKNFLSSFYKLNKNKKMTILY